MSSGWGERIDPGCSEPRSIGQTGSCRTETYGCRINSESLVRLEKIRVEKSLPATRLCLRKAFSHIQAFTVCICMRGFLYLIRFSSIALEETAASAERLSHFNRGRRI
jgi:hypothetical protein